MKKSLFVFLTVLLCACSSDDDNNVDKPTMPTEPKPLTQYGVEYKISNIEIDSYPQNDKLKRRTFVLEKKDDVKLGNLGVLYFCSSSDGSMHKSYDICCPIHWEDSDPLKHKLEIEESGHWVYANCNVKGFTSSFNLEVDGEDLNGYAGKHKIKLVKYKVEQYPKNEYPPHPTSEGRYLTNPNYKRK